MAGPYSIFWPYPFENPTLPGCSSWTSTTHWRCWLLQGFIRLSLWALFFPSRLKESLVGFTIEPSTVETGTVSRHPAVVEWGSCYFYVPSSSSFYLWFSLLTFNTSFERGQETTIFFLFGLENWLQLGTFIFVFFFHQTFTQGVWHNRFWFDTNILAV